MVSSSVVIAITDLDTGYRDGGHRKLIDSFTLEKNHIRVHRGDRLSWVLDDKKGDVRNRKVRKIRSR